MEPLPSRPVRLQLIGEPRLQDLIDDPTLHILMKRDGVDVADLTEILTLARKRLIARRWRRPS